MNAGPAKFVRTVVVASIAAAAPAWPADVCAPDTLKFITVNGTIHFVKTSVRPIVGRDGKADYSIVDMIDEYELSAPDMICGPKPLRVRFEYGDVRVVACADNVPATVSGFLRRDDGEVFLSIVSPSGLVCAPAK